MDLYREERGREAMVRTQSEGRGVCWFMLVSLDVLVVLLMVSGVKRVRVTVYYS